MQSTLTAPSSRLHSLELQRAGHVVELFDIPHLEVVVVALATVVVRLHVGQRTGEVIEDMQSSSLGLDSVVRHETRLLLHQVLQDGVALEVRKEGEIDGDAFLLSEDELGSCLTVRGTSE